MNFNTRKEIKCSCCGKSRFLSIQEAEEDGWRMLSDKGLCCYQCIPKYSIPTTFLRPPKFVGLDKSCNDDIGLRIEY